jgi:ribosome-binding ATPase YchF (GTP1/OBG family)
MLFLTDLLQIERRLDRLEREHKKDQEYGVLSRIGARLEEGKAICRQGLSEAEKKTISGFRFLSAKKLLIVLNKDEDNAFPDESVNAYCIERGYEPIVFYGAIEEEIGMLPPEEQKEFLDDIGLTGSATARFVNRCYAMLDLISFFTVGEDEVRAWNIRRGSSAAEAAARIHTDIAKGFIRAETVSYREFIEVGSFKALKERGLLRLESKEYTVQDGEIMHFRFNL